MQVASVHSRTFLTGIKPTGTMHIGNYVGAVQPMIKRLTEGGKGFLFIADAHALTSVTDGATMRQQTRHVAAVWLAALQAAGFPIVEKNTQEEDKRESLGATSEDPSTHQESTPAHILFYRQSALPQVFELFWILSCLCPKGLMNRAHAYKAVIQPRMEKGDKDIDRDVMMGLFNYPVLMAADILLFGAHQVPVGPDQVQHVEYARDLAQKFNQVYGETFALPEAVIPKEVPALQGLDGRKMSKSYGNIIPLMTSAKELRAYVMKMKTNSQRPEEPKDPEACHLFSLYRAFAPPTETAVMRARYAAGIGWAEAKQLTFDTLDAVLQPLRTHYEELIGSPKQIDAVLALSERTAYIFAEKRMRKVRRRVGLVETPHG